eukprot:5418745-Prymnesium_polylepis.1
MRASVPTGGTNGNGQPALMATFAYDATSVWQTPLSLPKKLCPADGGEGGRLVSAHPVRFLGNGRDRRRVGRVRSVQDIRLGQASKVLVRHSFRAKGHLPSLHDSIERGHVQVVHIQVNHRIRRGEQTEGCSLDWGIAPPVPINAACQIDGIQKCLHLWFVPPANPRHEKVGEEDRLPLVGGNGWQCLCRALVDVDPAGDPNAERLNCFGVCLQGLKPIGVVGRKSCKHGAARQPHNAHIFVYAHRKFKVLQGAEPNHRHEVTHVTISYGTFIVR